jgi:DNA invertase Pin-like site-specific DNA recombinase
MPETLIGYARCSTDDQDLTAQRDRLARSVPDARAIGDDLAARGIKLSLGGQVYDPTDLMGKMFFNILAAFAELFSVSRTTVYRTLQRDAAAER